LQGRFQQRADTFLVIRDQNGQVGHGGPLLGGFRRMPSSASFTLRGTK
jgi:hypothetical protein